MNTKITCSILALSLALTSGCSRRCGTYEAMTGLEKVVGLDVYDYDRNDMFETCGETFGAFGAFTVDDEDLGALTLQPDHRDMAIDTHICTDLYYLIYFDNRSLEVGQDLTILDGEAGIYATLFASFREGTISVLDSREPEDECVPFRSQDFKISWDLSFGDPQTGTNYYYAQGEDWVGITLPMSYGDPGC